MSVHFFYSVTELIFQDVFWNMNKYFQRFILYIFVVYWTWSHACFDTLLFNVFALAFLKLDASVQTHNIITSYHNSRYVLSYCTKIHNIKLNSKSCTFNALFVFFEMVKIVLIFKPFFFFSFMISLCCYIDVPNMNWIQVCTWWVWFAWISMEKINVWVQMIVFETECNVV